MTGVQTCALPNLKSRGSNIKKKKRGESRGKKVEKIEKIEKIKGIKRSEERREGKECRYGGSRKH